jgi:predicted NBD/HSP70 family sugar kinase
MHIVVDIGGTKTRVAAAENFESFGAPLIFESSHDYRQGFANIVAAAHELAGEAKIEGMALGAPGVISKDKRRLVHVPNLPHWNGAAICPDLEKALGAPALLENDAAFVALGEAVVGAGKGAAIVAYITISTGVNGARVVDGVVDRSAQGFEMGEQILGVDLTSPTFEFIASGVMVEQRFGKPPHELGADHPVWDELARITAIAVHNTIAYWSPDRVVIGGSMMNEIGISIDRVRDYLSSLSRKNPSLPEVVHGALGEVGGLWGALVALRDMGARGGRN